MVSTLDREWQVIRRTGGGYVNGEASLPTEGAPEAFVGNIQPLERFRFDQMMLNPQGRDFTAAYKVFTSAAFNVAGDNSPGDVILYHGKRLLTVGKTDWTGPGSNVSHYVYAAIEEIEKGNEEGPL